MGRWRVAAIKYLSEGGGAIIQAKNQGFSRGSEVFRTEHIDLGLSREHINVVTPSLFSSAASLKKSLDRLVVLDTKNASLSAFAIPHCSRTINSANS